ncbi:hypothetical protein ACIRVF_19765 [Kitasatospora sp. NPDC101157]|uniref:hypothetical protein n=1 Tax=Kitasatospora sp. NPDC101157 TaxID=3364098 RepID=UPI00380F7FCD
MLIPGYGGGPLVAGEPLLEDGGFWWCHLVGPAEPGPGEGWLEPDREADGVLDPAERLLLLLPALDGAESPAGAVERVAEDSARGTAVRLLEGHRHWAGHLSVGDSPLSG